MKYALLSVSDKTEIVTLANFLIQKEISIISTGGTGKLLKDNDIPFIPIEEITGNPEAFDGRMKTISFQIGSGLLFKRGDQEDESQAFELGIKPIDFVVCNLYPFEEVAKQDFKLEALIENIDIGGPTMIRAAAKNYKAVTVLTDPSQYEDFIQNFDSLNEKSRYQYALQALSLTAHYDSFISNHLKRFHTDEVAPPVPQVKSKELRYGENPHQKAWLKEVQNTDNRRTLANTTPLQGKALSYNNMLDSDTAWKCNSDLHNQFNNQSCITIIKHANPCGVAVGKDSMKALTEAWACDPVSSFGSVICANTQINDNMANWLSQKFVEIIIAPSFSAEAKSIFAQKKNLRLLELEPKLQNANEVTVRSINGGFLIQEEDELMQYEFNNVTKQTIPENFTQTKSFGMVVNKYLKSNAITLVASKDDYLVLAGAGMGQPNRLDSLKMLAAPRAKNLGFNPQDLLLISDAFFPFKDSIEVCQEVGIKNIIQPGGSIRDNEVIDCCDSFNIAMEFSQVRHFRH